MTRWYVKRKPTKVSAFRDSCPYLAEMRPLGSMWAQTRAEAMPFSKRAGALNALRVVREWDKDVVLVRVTGSEDR